ncbi:MAG: aminomethyl-transferring glycine dehydrogenase subunit GcvPA [Thermoplasmata archaeon]|nr:aminomethyl-transferring glycine dehydrogenase subunit GcvPA [Thermoplasmata archaeon]
MDEIHKMLAEIGVGSVEELFSDIPEEVRTRIQLPGGMDEIQVEREIRETLKRNRKLTDFACFLGGGIYNHYVPEAVNEIIGRQEFYTAYTPYQAEISQGVLQAIFEYQSMVCELTGMDCANASMYDAATALGEAALMSRRIKEGNEFIIPAAISSAKKSVLANYTRGAGIKIIEIPYNEDTGTIDVENLKERAGKETCGIYIESPNYFGCFETELKAVREICNFPLVVGVNLLSLSVVKPPSEFGADIVIGNSLVGASPTFGGPLAGIFAAKKSHLWKMPGRIVGYTHDSEGRMAFCLTLQPREQHIRRARATSNICSNETLSAIASLAYVALMGRTGLKNVALLCMKNARKLQARLREAGVKLKFEKGTGFNEFVYLMNTEFLDFAKDHGVLAGIPLEREFGIENGILCATTEMNTEAELEKFAGLCRQYLGGA